MVHSGEGPDFHLVVQTLGVLGDVGKRQVTELVQGRVEEYLSLKGHGQSDQPVEFKEGKQDKGSMKASVDPMQNALVMGDPYLVQVGKTQTEDRIDKGEG